MRIYVYKNSHTRTSSNTHSSFGENRRTLSTLSVFLFCQEFRLITFNMGRVQRIVIKNYIYVDACFTETSIDLLPGALKSAFECPQHCNFPRHLTHIVHTNIVVVYFIQANAQNHIDDPNNIKGTLTLCFVVCIRSMLFDVHNKLR